MSITISKNSVKYKEDDEWKGLNNVLDGIKELPTVTADDDGKILQVINGVWELSQDQINNKLSLSGGVVSGNMTVSTSYFAPFRVNREGTSGSGIAFSNDTGILGYVGMNSADEGLKRWCVDTSQMYVILDTGNYATTLDERYLKLAGGTVNGTLNISTSSYGPLVITREGSDKTAGIKFVNSNGDLGSIGMNAVNTALLRWSVDGATSYKILDTGNYTTTLDARYSLTTHKHAAGDIASGTLAVARGGTGKTTEKDAANAFLNALDVGSSNPVDADYYISQYVGGGTTTTTYYRRPVSALWNYINGKLKTDGTAAKANVLNSNTTMTYGWNGVNYFNIPGTAGNAAKVNDTPTSSWWHIMRFNHANSDGYYTDLAIPFNANSLYYKRVTGGTVQNKGWVKVLDELNYSSYVGSMQFVGTKNVDINDGRLSGNTVSNVTAHTFTPITGAAGYIAIPIMTGWCQLSGLSISGNTINICFVNNGANERTATCTVVLIGYKYV